MKFRRRPRLAALLAIALATSFLLAGCGAADEDDGLANEAAATPEVPFATGPLPDEGFRAQLAFAEPPARMRAGESQTILVKVKNASPVRWKVRGGEQDNKYYIAVGNRWFRSDGTTLATNMDGRYGLPYNLAPGEEATAPLVIKAPSEPGDYVLDLDLVQEQVSWFHERGSETTRTKVTVTK